MSTARHTTNGGGKATAIRLSRLSLVEVLVAIGIVAVLLALLLPAVQKIRLAASILREKNKVKQIELALHMWDEQQGGQRKRATIFLDILNYIEHPLTPDQLEQFDTAYHIPIYVNESDPSIIENKGGVSYAIINRFISIRNTINGTRYYGMEHRIPSTSPHNTGPAVPSQGPITKPTCINTNF